MQDSFRAKMGLGPPPPQKWKVWFRQHCRKTAWMLVRARPIFGKIFLRKIHIFIEVFFIKSFHFFLFRLTQFPNEKLSASCDRSSAKRKLSFLERKKAFFYGAFVFFLRNWSILFWLCKIKQRKTQTFIYLFCYIHDFEKQALRGHSSNFYIFLKIISMMPAIDFLKTTKKKCTFFVV